MKEFNAKQFCKELVMLRGEETQYDFAIKLGINRSTLSLLENGKQIPALDIYSKICNMMGKSTDEFFMDTTKDSLVYLMGSLDSSDKEKIEAMADRIKIKEKYELLAKRGIYVDD